MSWTPKHEEILSDLAARGFSASEIAENLPELPATPKRPIRKVNRDMVLGKARRMGIRLNSTPERETAETC